MATTLACYTENGCPEQFPNGDEGQQLQIVGGIPVWVDPVVGTTSIVTDNGDGTYTHDDGDGNLTIIDTRATSNPFGSVSNLTSTNVNAAVNELANAQEGFRVIGPVGVAAAANEPTRADDLSVDDNIQHRGKVMVGFANGEALSAIPAGNFSAEFEDGIILRNTNGTAKLTFFQDNAAIAANLHMWEFFTVNTVQAGANPVFMQLRPLNDAGATINDIGGMSWDRRGNFMVSNGGMATTDLQGSSMTQYLRSLINGAQTGPAALTDFNLTAQWATLIAGVAEQFVMDGAGNVTQETSHPPVAAELIPTPDSHPTARYSFDYNIFSGLGTIALNAGSRSKSLVFDIDTGNYDIYDIDGVVESSGNDARLAEYGSGHPMPQGVARGQPYWDFTQARIQTAVTDAQDAWDKATEEEQAEMGERPADFVSVALPPSLSKQFSIDKPIGIILSE